MTSGGGGDFRVDVAELREAGDKAAEIGDRMHRHGDDQQVSAETVSGGLDGFALSAALDGCAGAWEGKLDSLAQQITGAGKAVHTNASNYEKADAAGQVGFDAISAGRSTSSPGS